jgi:putative oxidoreductase
MEAMGVPGILLWPTIALEILGGLAVAIGYRVCIAAPALAVFTLVAAGIFHHNFSDQMQMIMFLKDLAIAGGLLILASGGKR